MARLPFPSSSTDMPRFRDRIQKSPPAGKVDHDWLINYMGFTQRSNAGSLLSFLRATGFVEDGVLTERGMLLLGPSNAPEYRQGMKDAIDQLLGAERAATIRAGTIKQENLPAYLQHQFKVGSNVVMKFFPGLRWLATEAGDDEILAVCPQPRSAKSEGESKQSTVLKTSRSTRKGTARSNRNPSENPPSTSTSGQGSFRVPDTGSVEEKSPTAGFTGALLRGDVIQVRIDHNWTQEDIRSTLRMLQLLERGELIPEIETHE